MMVLTRAIDFPLVASDTLLLVRLLLELINASHNSGFFQFIRAATNPFFAPFRGIVASTSLDGSHRIARPLVIAIAAYMIVHGIILSPLLVSSRGLERQKPERVELGAKAGRAVVPLSISTHSAPSWYAHARGLRTRCALPFVSCC